MKAGIFILSFLFVILTIQPAFIKWNNVSCAKGITSARLLPKAGCAKSAEKKCSSTADKKVPAKPQTDDPCNTCNPFMVCNGCAYMPGEATELGSPGMVNPENTNWLIDGSVSSFPGDCWHPPELFRRL